MSRLAAFRTLCVALMSSAVLSNQGIAVNGDPAQLGKNSYGGSVYARELSSTGANYDCSVCPQSASLCCDCCIQSSFVVAACNSAVYVSNGCLASGASASPKNTPSVSPTWGRSASFTPVPTANIPTFNTTVTFSAACTTTAWVVPANVFSIGVHLWGSGGQWSHGAGDLGYGNGGAGAFVSGLAAVTPGQVLSVTVGGVYGGELCGWGGTPQPGSGGGFTAISRLDPTSFREYLAVAGGGGGGGMYNNGLPGLGFQSSATACGLWAPAGQNYTLWASGAGGGGWQGGTAGTQGTYGVGTGGTSCGAGLIAGTAISMAGSPAHHGAGGTEGLAAPNTQSRYYLGAAGMPIPCCSENFPGSGLAVITFNMPVGTGSPTASATVPPTHTRSVSAIATAASATLTPSVPPAPAFVNSTIFNTACSMTSWTVPLGVREVAVYLWGSGGQVAYASKGSAGAYVSGRAVVTPGEELVVTVGGVRGGEVCGWGGMPQPGSGGGFSAISRVDLTTSTRTYLAVAAGGGGGGYWNNGYPGQAFFGLGDACGAWSPAGQNQTLWASGSGGGGWQGGAAGVQNTYGSGLGGTSCAAGLISATSVGIAGSPAYSQAGGTDGIAVGGVLGVFYSAGAGLPTPPGSAGTGRVVIVHGILNSPSRTPFTQSLTGSASRTVAPSSSSSATRTPPNTGSSSGTGTLSGTATLSATRTPSGTGSLSDTPTSSSTGSQTGTGSASGTGTQTGTPSSSNTASGSATPSQTGTPSSSKTASGTSTSSITGTPSSSVTATRTSTSSVTATRTSTSSVTGTPSSSVTATRTSTSSITGTPSSSVTATRTSTSSITGTPSSSATASRTSTPSKTRTPSSSGTASRTSTSSGTRTQTASGSSTRTVSPTTSGSQTGTRTPSRSATRSGTGSRTPTRSRSGSATATASVTKTASRSFTPPPTKYRRQPCGRFDWPACTTDTPSRSRNLVGPPSRSRTRKPKRQ